MRLLTGSANQLGLDPSLRAPTLLWRARNSIACGVFCNFPTKIGPAPLVRFSSNGRRIEPPICLAICQLPDRRTQGFDFTWQNEGDGLCRQAKIGQPGVRGPNDMAARLQRFQINQAEPLPAMA